MRFLMQGLAMLSDVLVFLAIATLLYFEHREPFVWIACALGLKAWHDSGGLIAWKAESRRLLMDNAKRLGP